MLKFISVGVWGLQVRTCYPSLRFTTDISQAIMAIVVLALSIELTKDIRGLIDDGRPVAAVPTTTKYSVFCGGFGLAVAVFGAAAAFFDFIPALVVMAADAVSGVLLLAGGIAFAIGLRGINCDEGDIKRLYENDIINRGKTEGVNGDWASTGTAGEVLGNCKKAFADQAMQFVTCGFALATIALVFLVWKKNRSGGGRAYV
ncbi:hypothetical protein CKAH01_05138 [Colletotrichum kahawae]|uniref:MARVEL domain-containing protein n=1 Tax=Colletotrichum kahawae TaxID=34407 RepID=A0AAE0D721_COLKA|nr:hypothetical protein CKAH01_05138 [Colletotrichum kahawae]